MSPAEEPGGAGAENTQDEPRLEMHATTQQERLDGIVAQLRADVQGENTATVDKAVRTRLAETGVAADEDTITRLVAELSST